jgi:gamma-glutamyltranspeptidase/glutathione hydrolase
MPDAGPATVTVPGAVRGWEALHAQGASLPWADGFQAGIAAATEGFAVTPDLAGTLAWRAEALRTDPGFREVYLHEGVPPAGARLVQPALGRTLAALASGGADALYTGDLARAFVQGLRSSGVPITIEDLAGDAADLVPALRGRYRDLDVSVSPPGTQGFVLLEALAVLERLEIDPDPLGPHASTLAMILRAASSDRDRHLADPEAMTLHVSALLDDGHIGALCDVVRTGLAEHRGTTAGHRHDPSDTIALVTADSDGWGVSLLQSLSDDFGAGILEPSTGIVVHDRGSCFTLDPGHPNELAPRKRPAHTLMPVAVHREGELVALTGTRGGYGQPQIDLMTIVRSFDLGLDPAEAVSAPRWLLGGMSPLEGDPWLRAEETIPEPVRNDLQSNGFRVETCGPMDRAVGHAQMIRIEGGSFKVGSDPRADGGALAS